MKIKAADIARNLNLSKATVSLVLNNKPGVSEKTRRKVFDYIEEVTGEPEKQKEEKDKQNQELENKNIIKVLYIDNHLRFLKNFELDVCPDSLTIFEQEARRMGCIVSVTYASSTKKEDVERVVREANEENVAGVILYATEMQPDQFPPFRAIRKPMVIYDNDLGNEYHCVTFGGVEGIRDCVIIWFPEDAGISNIWPIPRISLISSKGVQDSVQDFGRMACRWRKSLFTLWEKLPVRYVRQH